MKTKTIVVALVLIILIPITGLFFRQIQNNNGNTKIGESETKKTAAIDREIESIRGEEKRLMDTLHRMKSIIKKSDPELRSYVQEQAALIEEELKAAKNTENKSKTEIEALAGKAELLEAKYEFIKGLLNLYASAIREYFEKQAQVLRARLASIKSRRKSLEEQYKAITYKCVMP